MALDVFIPALVIPFGVLFIIFAIRDNRDGAGLLGIDIPITFIILDATIAYDSNFNQSSVFQLLVSNPERAQNIFSSSIYGVVFGIVVVVLYDMFIADKLSHYSAIRILVKRGDIKETTINNTDFPWDKFALSLSLSTLYISAHLIYFLGGSK